MASNSSFRHSNGINLIPQTSTATSGQGDIDVDSTSTKTNYHNGTTSSPFVTETHASTGANRLQSKDLSADNTKFVDPSDTTKAIKFSASGNATGHSTTIVSAASLDRTFTLPDISDTAVVLTASQTLTNKTIDASSNTISNIANANISATAAIAFSKLANLTNAHILVGNGSNVATDVAVSGDLTLANTGAFTVATVGGSSSTNIHSAELAANAATSSNTNSTIVLRDGSGNFSAGTITATLTGNSTNVSGTVTETHGGTNQTSYTKGDILYASASNTLSKLGIGAANQVIQSVGGIPSWQTAPVGGINYISANPNFEVDTTGWTAYNDTQTVTITNASPAVFTVTSTTGMTVGLPVSFTTTGGLPTGLTSGTTYYISNVINGTTFNVSATLGGANVNTSSAGSGTHTFRPLKPVTLTSAALSGLTFSRSTSSPLRGTGSGLLTQTNATVVAGQGEYYAFTVDSADQAKALAVSFDYNADSNFSAANGTTAPNSGGAGDSDIEVFIYDVTNSALIPVSPQVITANGANNFTFKGTFQTASNSTSYRLALHTSKTSAASTGYNFKFDNVFVGPQAIAYGPPVTDWVDETANFGFSASFGTVTAAKIFTRRVGDTLYIKGRATSGIPTAAIATLNLGKYVIDSTKMPTSSTHVGYGHTILTGSTSIFSAASATMAQFYDGSTTGQIFFTYSVLSNDFIKRNANDFVATGVPFEFDIFIPIAGWSSTTQMSQDTDTRVVSFAATNNGGSATANTAITSGWTKVTDSHNAFSTSTGIYTVPVSGSYIVSWKDQMASGSAQAQIQKNGSVVATGIGTGAFGLAVALLSCTAGDTITVSDGFTNTIASSNTATYVSISRVSGPSTIAATETVACVVNGQPANMTANNPIIFPTVLSDTHGAYNTTTGKYTCPAAGFYQINTFFVATTLTANLQVNIFKNGVLYNGIGSGVANSQAYGSGIVQCLAGDTINVSTNTSTSGFSATATSNNLSIARIR